MGLGGLVDACVCSDDAVGEQLGVGVNVSSAAGGRGSGGSQSGRRPRSLKELLGVAAASLGESVESCHVYVAADNEVACARACGFGTVHDLRLECQDYPKHCPPSRAPWNLAAGSRGAGCEDDGGSRKRKHAENGAGDAVPSLVGVCVWYDTQKGYGFVSPQGCVGDRSQEVFVHQSVIVCDGFRRLERGNRVR